MLPILPSVVSFTMSFFLVALAAKQIGKFFSQYGLPYITGYLLAGALAGPFILGMLPQEASGELRYIDDISLAVIAFIAGSELYLKELRERLRSILLNAAGIAIVAFIMLSVAMFFLQSFISFTATYPPLTKIAVAILGSTILLALSPASTIAVIQEVHAKGPFSKMILSITVVMDVVIIVLFAISVAFASAMLDSNPVNATFVLLLLVDIAVALIAGYWVGKGIALVLSTPLHATLKMLVLLVSGFLIFEASFWVPEWTYDTWNFKLKIEPLLIAMFAGFTVTNFTRYRQAFEDLLHDISPYVYVAFFALTGVALKLDVLFSTIGIAMILFMVRMLAIIIGTYAGGTFAKEDVKFKRWAGLGLVTQAGIALGLARETAVEFPDTLGGEFATLIIAVVVLNEIFGPLFLKFALRQVGEALLPSGDGGGRSLLILGVEPSSIALARELTQRGWHVTLADTSQEQVTRLQTEEFNEHYIEQIDEANFRSLLNGGIDGLVAMLDDDLDNLKACQLAYEKFAVRNLVVRLREVTLRDAFEPFGARVLDPASAMVNLLLQYVRAPEAVELLLQKDPEHEVVQVRVADKAVDGLALRDLRLPNDVLILEIIRDGQVIVPHGFSTLRLRDEVTLVGSPANLVEVTLKLSY